jgi:glycosyltransferase involved in cell wall biosynthesis
VRVAILLESFQPEYWGGRETRWNRLLPVLTQHHQITVFADFSRVSPTNAFPDCESVQYIDIGPLPPMYKVSGNRSLKHALLFSTRTLFNLNRDFDIVLCDQTPIISIPLLRFKSLLSRFELVVVWHEIWDLQTWFRYSKYLGLFGYLLEFFAVLMSSNIVVPSKRVQVSLNRKKFYSCSKIIPNGVDRVAPFRDPNTFQSPSPILNLLYVGRIIKHKNCQTLIKIMEKANYLGKNWHLTIVGGGPDLNELKSSATRLGLSHRISFLANVSSPELEKIYSHSKVFVFPSEREGFGISVSEALSRDIPVVIYDYKSNASIDLLSNENWGVKLADLSVEKWVAAIEHTSSMKSKSISNEFLLTQESWGEVGEKFVSYLSQFSSPVSLKFRSQD